MSDQPINEIEGTDGPGRNWSGIAQPDVRTARISHLMQRGPPLRGGVRVSARVEQHRSQLVMRIDNGQHQRARPVRQGVVDLRTRGEQCLGRLDMPGTCCKQQRGKPAGRARIGLGTEPNQEFGDVGVVPVCRPHQRGLLSLDFRRANVGSMPEQALDGVGPARARCHHQDGLAVRGRRVGVGAGIQESVDDRAVAVLAGQCQRRHTVPISRRRVSACLDQESDDVRVVVVDRPMQRCRAVGLRAVDINVSPQERTNGRRILGLHCLDERQIAACRAEAEQPSQQQQTDSTLNVHSHALITRRPEVACREADGPCCRRAVPPTRRPSPER